ncbi:MAG TPA: acetyl-CoA carboxylase biotin carboxylase subunit, partial [Chromatiaceae bacterium]|nr:acetyl-CoA carboxylase biotin carboxylase subunit [Chromatiaceae bacterium]
FGRISRYYAPGGPGVRTDTAIYTGYTIPPYFDSMIAKVIVWALTWEDAISRGERTLKDMEVHGIRTTKLYYEEILRHPEFRAANFTTSFVEDHPELTEYTEKQCKSDVAAAIAVAVAAHAGL